MSPEQRRFIVRDYVVVLAIINLVINAGVAVLAFWTLERVPLWGAQSIVGDTMATAFLLPLLVCLISTPITRKQVCSGHVQPLNWRRDEHLLLRLLPRKARFRGIVLGTICLCTIAPLTIFALTLCGVDGMSFSDFMVFKSLFAGILAVLIGPLVGIWAIATAHDGHSALVTAK